MATRKEKQQIDTNQENGVTAAAEIQQPPFPELTVRIYPQHKKGSNLLANASVDIGGIFAAKGFRIFQGENGPFVRVPSYSYVKNGTQQEKDAFFPVTREAREKLFGQILQSYEYVMSQEQKAPAEGFEEVPAGNLPFEEDEEPLPVPEEEPAPVMSM